MGLFKSLLFIVALFVLAGLLVTALAQRDTHRRIVLLEAERALAETRHGQMEYTRWGDGPVVLVIHGAGGGYDQGRLLTEAVGANGYDWISVSRFGYLGSALPEHPSTANQAEAFVDLLDALDVERVNILAMSGGVPPALKFAELYPDRTERMVLLSPAPFTPFGPDVENRPVSTWIYSALFGNDVIFWCLTKVARSWVEGAFDARDDLKASLPAKEDGFIRELVDSFLPTSRRIQGVNNEGAAVDPEATYNLEIIDAPVLVVHARDDRLNPFEVSENIASRIERADLLAFERGGHLLLSHHQEISIKIDVFFGAHGEP